MKYVSSILLIGLLLFNFIGYNIFFHIAETISDKKTDIIVEKEEYDEKDLVLFEIPLLNPYQLNQPEYQAIGGEIVLDDIVYRMIKRKITDGNLILYCLPVEKTLLRSARNNYYKEVNNLTDKGSAAKDSSHSRIHIYKSVISEYDYYGIKYACAISMDIKNEYSFTINASLLTRPKSSPWQPPDLS